MLHQVEQQRNWGLRWGQEDFLCALGRWMRYMDEVPVPQMLRVSLLSYYCA